MIKNTPIITTSLLIKKDDINNSNDKSLTLISKIQLKHKSDELKKCNNIIFLSDKRLAMTYNNYIYIFSKNLYKTDIIIETNKDILKRHYDYNHDVNYIIQLKNGILAVAIQWEKIFFIKIDKNIFELKGKIFSKNVYKIIEKNNHLYNLEDYELSIWRQKNDNQFSYEKVNRIKINDNSFTNFIFINEYEILLYYGNILLFYNINTNSKKIEDFIFCHNNGIYRNNMILIDSNTVLIYDINIFEEVDIFLIDTFKKKQYHKLD